MARSYHLPEGPRVVETGARSYQIPGGPRIVETSGAGGGVSVDVTAATLTLTGSTITGSQSNVVTASSLALTGSSITGSQSHGVTASNLTLTGSSITSSQSHVVTAGSLTLTGSDVTFSSSGSVTVTVDPGSLTLTGASITGTQSHGVTASSLTLTGSTITTSISVALSAASLTLTGSSITGSSTGPVSVTVDPGVLTLIGSDIEYSPSGQQTRGGAGKAKVKKKRSQKSVEVDPQITELIRNLESEKYIDGALVHKSIKEVVKLAPEPSLQEVKKTLEGLKGPQKPLEASTTAPQELQATPIAYDVEKALQRLESSFTGKMEEMENQISKLKKKITSLEELIITLNA